MRAAQAIVVAAAVASGGMADARPLRPTEPEVKGVSKGKTLKPERGFIDDGIAWDGAGGRLAYVAIDPGKSIRLRVYDANLDREVRNVDLGQFGKAPKSVHFVGGDKFLLIYQDTLQSLMVARTVDTSGKQLRSFGPATKIQFGEHGDDEVVVLYNAKPKGGGMAHTVTVLRAATGAKLGRPRTVVTDAGGRARALKFQSVRFENHYTQLLGMRDGEWNRKAGQRLSDYEAVYGFPSGKFVRGTPVNNLLDHAKRMRLLEGHHNERVFVQPSRDFSKILAISSREVRAVHLAEPIGHYRLQSIESRPVLHGVWFSIVINPMHAAARGSRRAAPKWMDIYYLADGQTKAERKARIRLRGSRNWSWQVSADWLAVGTRHVGFDRGNREITVFRLSK